MHQIRYRIKSESRIWQDWIVRNADNTDQAVERFKEAMAIGYPSAGGQLEFEEVDFDRIHDA